VGLQLVVSRVIMAALAELNQREPRIAGDMLGREVEATGEPSRGEVESDARGIALG
jgi:hypothetical protein